MARFRDFELGDVGLLDMVSIFPRAVFGTWNIPVKYGVHYYAIFSDMSRVYHFCTRFRIPRKVRDRPVSLLLATSGEDEFPSFISSMHVYALSDSAPIEKVLLEKAWRNFLHLCLTAYGTVCYMLYPTLPKSGKIGLVGYCTASREVYATALARDRERRYRCLHSNLGNVGEEKLLSKIGKVVTRCVSARGSEPNVISIVDGVSFNAWRIDYTKDDLVRKVCREVYANIDTARIEYIFTAMFNIARRKILFLLYVGNKY